MSAAALISFSGCGFGFNTIDQTPTQLLNVPNSVNPYFTVDLD